MISTQCKLMRWLWDRALYLTSYRVALEWSIWTVTFKNRGTSFKTKSSWEDSDTVGWRQMHLSSSGNIAIVGSFLLFQSLLSDYFGKKKFQAPPPVLPPVSQKWTTTTALIIIFLTTYGAKGRRTRRWKSRLFWLALYCSSMCNLVPLFLKVPDQIDHSSATP